MAVVAFAALVGVALYASQLSPRTGSARLGTGADPRRRGGQSDRSRCARATSWTSWTSTGALALLGVQRGRRRHQRRRGHADPRSAAAGAAGERWLIARASSTCFLNSSSSARSPSTRYGVLLAAAYLLGLKLAMARAQARGLDANRVLDLGIYIIVCALVGAKLLLRRRRLRPVPAESRRSCCRSARSGGVFYGGLIAAVRWRSGTCGGTACRSGDLRRVRAGHRAGTRRRAARVSGGGLLLRAADRRAVGDHVHEPAGRGERRHAAGRAAPSDAALRERRPSC